MSPTVSRRSSAIAAIDGGSEHSEWVSPASVNGVHLAASADTSGASEGKGGARDSAGLTRVASSCTSSGAPCQGEGRRFDPVFRSNYKGPALLLAFALGKMEIAPPSRSPVMQCFIRESAGRSPQSLGRGSSHRAKERLKSVRRDPDRVRYAHVVQFAALTEAVHRGRGHAEPCSYLFDREKRADPNRASHRSPDHGRTKILGKRRYRLERIGQVLLSVL
jgi:hypothetical protein